jgi:hypothetical protein
VKAVSPAPAVLPAFAPAAYPIKKVIHLVAFLFLDEAEQIRLFHCFFPILVVKVLFYVSHTFGLIPFDSLFVTHFRINFKEVATKQVISFGKRIELFISFFASNPTQISLCTGIVFCFTSNVQSNIPCAPFPLFIQFSHAIRVLEYRAMEPQQPRAKRRIYLLIKDFSSLICFFLRIPPPAISRLFINQLIALAAFWHFSIWALISYWMAYSSSSSKVE